MAKRKQPADECEPPRTHRHKRHHKPTQAPLPIYSLEDVSRKVDVLMATITELTNNLALQTEAIAALALRVAALPAPIATQAELDAVNESVVTNTAAIDALDLPPTP